MNGIIVVDKPAGFTSFDVVAVMRGIFHEKKIGHTGTLDPMATGVLPVLVGRAAKAADILPDTSKEYIADFKLGIKTDTADITGKALQQQQTSLNAEDIKGVIPGFRGSIMQLPPMYSAVSVNGKRLYELARKGIEVERKLKEVRVDALELLSFSEQKQEGRLHVSCSKGTYIRTLIEDIAEALGTIAAMSALRRTYACGFSEADALKIEDIKAAENPQSLLKPIENIFEDLKQVPLSPAQTSRFANGGALDVNRLKTENLFPGEMVKVYTDKGDFFAIGQYNAEKNELKMFKLFVIKEN